MSSDDLLMLSRYWGKADPQVGGHHTLLGHSLDVAATAYVLLDHHPVLRRRFAELLPGAPLDRLPTWLAGLCALHDLGKVDTRFQIKSAAVARTLRPGTAALAQAPYDHGVEGFRLVEQRSETDEELCAEFDRVLGDATLPLLRAVCGHHGSLPTSDEAAPRSLVPVALRREDASARAALVRVVASHFEMAAFAIDPNRSVDNALVTMLAGLCSVADWVGSDVEHFAYAQGRLEPASYWEVALHNAQVACERAGLLRAGVRGVPFDALFPGCRPRDVQVLTESLDLDEPALVVIEAAMGTGKTEAALALANRFMEHGLADGLVVALPTMATSNAMFERVEAAAGRMFVGGDVQLALAHGKASREPRFLRLTRRSLRAFDPDATEASVMCARWLLNRKRVLLAQVGVGTIDQALLASLAVRHHFVRLWGLSRSVVVIDEVHAYDAYMEVLLEHLLRWLGALRVPVVLLSATLPSERRTALVNAWQGREAPSTAVEEFEQAARRAYPLVTVASRHGRVSAHTLHDVSEPAAPTKRLSLELVRTPVDDEMGDEAAVDRLVTAARAGARVVWIRSTVRLAQRSFRRLKKMADGIECVLFHARFRGCDRRVVEQRVLERFGKDAAPGGRVLIATQVVEQSLDLDFDELHTDLAPIDLVLQRAGRLHRHVRSRPEGFEEPRLVVHAPSRGDVDSLKFGPARHVYDAATLWLANHALKERTSIRLPHDIRELVEQTYHPVARSALLVAGGPTLVDREKARADQLTARRVKARRSCTAPSSAEADGGSTVSDDESTAEAFTRDGASVTLLPFWWDGEGARGLHQSEDAPHWALDVDAKDAWRLAGDLADQTLSMPARDETRGILATGEAVVWDRWSERFARFALESGLGDRVVPLPMRRSADAHKGWLHVGGRNQRVLYSKLLGLSMPTERDPGDDG
jgi:CRISPR-associated endonuclease/helicase Cas3